MSRVVIVTGMHRSGTSFLGSVLHESGIDLGEQLVPAGDGNLRGHFEDAELVAFHQRILDRGWQPDSRTRPTVTSDDQRDAQALIAARSHKTHWGWKDPRTALFLDLWDDLLPQARWIFMVRNPFSVIGSLHRRDDAGGWWWRSDGRRLRWWRFQTRQCLSFAEARPDRCVVLEIDRAVDDFPACSAVLTRYLHHPIEEATLRKLYGEGLMERRSRWRFAVVKPWDYLDAVLLHRRACRMSSV